MKSVSTNLKRVIITKIEPGEDLIESLSHLIEEYKIGSGLINCIGALREFTLGFFNLEKKTYDFKTFKENVELISCIGNISYKDDKPIIHLHVNVGRSDYSVIGGHLSQPCIISVTAEVYLFETDMKVERLNDVRFNLSLLNIM
ncbi:MAG: DNA-binding protein [Candidatus Lokiarchaeota archaeon]|nr:DNA-binding protein [Candidatus Lokiarchaeota archaeon]